MCQKADIQGTRKWFARGCKNDAGTGTPHSRRSLRKPITGVALAVAASLPLGSYFIGRGNDLREKAEEQRTALASSRRLLLPIV